MAKPYNAEQLIQKAALALDDITSNGGVMEPEQLTQFLRIMQERARVLGEARVEVVSKGQKVLDRVGILSEFLRPGVEDDTEVYTDPATYLAKEKKPTLGKIALNCFKVSGSMGVSWEALQRNIEKEDFADTLVEIAARRAGYDIERLALNGVAANPVTTLLDLEDGFLKRVPASNVVQWGGAAFSRKVFADLIRKVPAKFRQNISEYRFYVSQSIEMAYRELLAARGTNLGDRASTEGDELKAFGAPVVGVDALPDANGSNGDEGVILFAHPDNLIYAIEDEIRLVDKYDEYRDGLVLFLHASVDIAVEEVNAIAKATGVKHSAISTTAHGY